MDQIEVDSILKLCAFKWVEYCGISRSCRTIYWDIAITLCGDSKIFERYILSCKYGDESLTYDTSIECSIDFYETLKDYELTHLTKDEQEIFLKGYTALIAEIQR